MSEDEIEAEIERLQAFRRKLLRWMIFAVIPLEVLVAVELIWLGGPLAATGVIGVIPILVASTTILRYAIARDSSQEQR